MYYLTLWLEKIFMSWQHTCMTIWSCISLLSCLQILRVCVLCTACSSITFVFIYNNMCPLYKCSCLSALCSCMVYMYLTCQQNACHQVNKSACQLAVLDGEKQATIKVWNRVSWSVVALYFSFLYLTLMKPWFKSFISVLTEVSSSPGVPLNVISLQTTNLEATVISAPLE